MADVLSFPAAATIPDAAARAQALDVTQSWIVEAPAGSGKTGLLMQRLLKLLASESVTEPDQVLAITFTRKATAELQERVLRQLLAADAGIAPENDFDRETRTLAEAVVRRSALLGWGLLDNPRRLSIRTIDSVCAEIARGLPILSGSGGGQAPTEDSAPLHAQAAHRTLMQLGGTDRSLNEAIELLLLHRDGSLGECERLIAAMLATRDQWGSLVPLSGEEITEHYLDTVVLVRLERALDLAICRALTRLTQVMPERTLSALCALAAEMAQLEGYGGNPSPIALCAGRTMPPAEKAAHLEHWHALIGLLLTKGGDFRAEKGLRTNTVAFLIEKHHKAELGRILDQVRDNEPVREALCAVRDLPEPRYPEEQWLVAKALFRILSRALVELQLVFSESGECDFAEVGLLARTALGRESALDDLSAAGGFRLQHLLVDEMQDTSSAQYELIQQLTQTWDGRSQTVFLVGDPKQSIYLFRQARVERFVRTMHMGRLGDVPLGQLQLTANFRSQRGLVGDFNDDFALLFPPVPDPLKPELVPFRAAAAVRRQGMATGRVWHTAALPYSADTAECRALRTRQSRTFAAEIRSHAARWRASGQPARIAVLVRTRTHLLDVVRAFRSTIDGTAIPYRAVEIEPLGERQEILDLLALTRALLHPGDRTAWLATLRAPWCGLALADLHTLAGQGDRSFAQTNVLDLMRERGDLLSEDGIARLQPVWHAMQTALAARGTEPLARWVERTWLSLGGHLPLAPEERANASRFFSLLDELTERTGSLDVDRLTAKLEKLYAAPSVHPGAVDLMTIHGAKGLEWDVVFVPALEKTGQVSKAPLLSWLEMDPDEAGAAEIAPGILAPIQGKGESSARLNKWLKSIYSAREAAERKRLFYVACTRAREELHLFAAPARKVAGEIGRRPDSLLAAAWAAAEPHFAAAEDAPLGAGNLIELPLAASALPGVLPGMLDLAATAVAPVRTMQRIPLAAIPAAGYRPPAETIGALEPAFQRPQGSFAARAFGNAMHAFLDLTAARLKEGTSFAGLEAELPAWQPRIAAVLRSSGLPAASVQRYGADVQRGLLNTLGDPVGRWILSPQARSASETSLAGDGPSVRLDRIFLAGPEPGDPGESHLWIIDFKTASHAVSGLDAFLRGERKKYEGQLEVYARAFEAEGLPIRLGLYYPMLAKLIQWPAQGESLQAWSEEQKQIPTG